MAATAAITAASARRPLRAHDDRADHAHHQTGVSVSRPRPDEQQVDRGARPRRGDAEEAVELSPSTAWPLRPGTATASE